MATNYAYRAISTDSERNRVNEFFQKFITDPSAVLLPRMKQFEKMMPGCSAWMLHHDGEPVEAARAGDDHFPPDLPNATPTERAISEYRRKNMVILQQVAVAREHRGRGIGTELIKLRREAAIAGGAEVVAAVIPDDAKAAAQCASLGFEVLDAEETLILAVDSRPTTSS